MATDERPNTFTPRDAWEAFDRLRDDTREARHAQNNLFQTAIANTEKAIRNDLAPIDSRLRVVENSLAAATPVSLGSRINDIEMWRSKADGESTLVARLNELESWRDEMRGSLTFLKVAATVIGLLSSIAAVLSWISLQAPRG